jgi:hypothetical protein
MVGLDGGYHYHGTVGGVVAVKPTCTRCKDDVLLGLGHNVLVPFCYVVPDWELLFEEGHG